ncbi:MAG: copper chaperone PCu(A)C [Amphritea sp.]|nr:copper chaperone PCu(A)C [Amphritea sp.]
MKKLITLLTALTLSCTAMADVQVSDAYARAVPPGQPNSAAFLTLKNTSDEKVALQSASSPAAKVVELHTHSHADGVMKMRKISQITLSGNEKVELKPGGLHIMMIGLNQNLMTGETISLTLDFSDGSSQTLDVEVKDVMAAMGKKHHH